MDTRNIPFANTVLFNLNTFITPQIIKIFYLVGMGTIALRLLQAIIAALSSGFFNGMAGLLAAIATAIFSLLVLRVVVEVIIIYFKNNDALMNMADVDLEDQDIFDDVKDSFNSLFPGDDDDLDLDLDEPETPPKPAAKPAATPAAAKPKSTRAKPATKAKSAPKAKPATKRATKRTLPPKSDS